MSLEGEEIRISQLGCSRGLSGYQEDGEVTLSPKSELDPQKVFPEATAKNRCVEMQRKV